MKIKLSKRWFLNEIIKKGYTINILTKGDSKYVTVYSPYAEEPLVIKHSYDVAWFDEDIKLDIVPQIVSWAGLKVVTSLE